MKNLFLILFILGLIQTSSASQCEEKAQNGLNHQPETSQLEKVIAGQLPDIIFCLYEFQYQNDFYLSYLVRSIKTQEAGAFINAHCFALNKISQTSEDKVIDLLKIMDGQTVEIYTAKEILQNDKSSIPKNQNWILSEEASSQAITKVGTNAIGGLLINKELYQDQHDKKLHSIVGAGISLSTSSLGYFLVKNSNISNTNKAHVINYSGPLVTLIIGVLKEVLYDNAHRDIHTVDKHDAIATAIGGGIIPLRFEMKF